MGDGRLRAGANARVAVNALVELLDFELGLAADSVHLKELNRACRNATSTSNAQVRINSWDSSHGSELKRRL